MIVLFTDFGRGPYTATLGLEPGSPVPIEPAIAGVEPGKRVYTFT